ncbi:imidazolonepropionase [Parvularcula sp. IMCC14364]|uniref:imidazolonepropionase n=1 Tax=Parvularcula sp. IMCC14364 TaxID=3067902 RepID=UPI0027426FE4|nr:imidazolonepropionase [Parvularcula sp. IMCC14364]
MWDTLLVNVNLATMDTNRAAPYGAVQNAALAIKDGLIDWLGPEAELSDAPGELARNVLDLDGKWATPGLIDCHTHLVFGGARASEYEMRLNGASYEEIARAGGGILSTVKATRSAPKETLYAAALSRLNALQSEGVTTVEIKSGYGLDLESEMKMLEVARDLGKKDSVEVVTTFLGAHALPPEYAQDREGYINLVCEEMIPAVARAGLADAVDAFCETIGFSTAETERVFKAARTCGLPVKLHAEQLSDSSGSQLAARYNALSVDHLEYLSPEGVTAIATTNTVAVLLPGAFYFLKETQTPPVQALRQASVPLAVATDCNPGSSPVTSPLLAMNMACTLFGLTPEEALTGMTRNASQALALSDKVGTLSKGKSADIALWNIATPAELSYWLGYNPLAGLFKAGREIFTWQHTQTEAEHIHG